MSQTTSQALDLLRPSRRRFEDDWSEDDGVGNSEVEMGRRAASVNFGSPQNSEGSQNPDDLFAEDSHADPFDDQQIPSADHHSDSSSNAASPQRNSRTSRSHKDALRRSKESAIEQTHLLGILEPYLKRLQEKYAELFLREEADWVGGVPAGVAAIFTDTEKKSLTVRTKLTRIRNKDGGGSAWHNNAGYEMDLRLAFFLAFRSRLNPAYIGSVKPEFRERLQSDIRLFGLLLNPSVDTEVRRERRNLLKELKLRRDGTPEWRGALGSVEVLEW